MSWLFNLQTPNGREPHLALYNENEINIHNLKEQGIAEGRKLEREEIMAHISNLGKLNKQTMDLLFWLVDRDNS